VGMALMTVNLPDGVGEKVNPSSVPQETRKAHAKITTE
jgi:hypothetical protein